MPFTPNNSEQRSPPTCYRGCWHVVSRGLFTGYRHHTVIPSGAYSSPAKELYNLSAFFIHAASLRQTSVHCGIFLAAASRRSLGRISVPMCPFTLSGRIPIGPYLSPNVSVHPLRPDTHHRLGGPLPPQQANGTQAHPRAEPWLLSLFRHSRSASSGITRYFYRLSPSRGQVTHALLTSPPL